MICFRRAALKILQQLTTDVLKLSGLEAVLAVTHAQCKPLGVLHDAMRVLPSNFGIDVPEVGDLHLI